jgi:nucleoid-associated protein YgaU
MTIHSEQRHPATNKITRATVDLEFTEKNDVAQFTGPVTGGAKSNGKPKSNSASSSKKKTGSNSGDKTQPKKAKTKVYVVKRGDTLSGIAYKLFGDTSKWRDLAKDNKIKNPKLLQVGTRLKY